MNNYLCGLELLLDLNDQLFRMTGGYWTKFEVKQVEVRPGIPHGIRYSLTLHDDSGKRLLGFDNAHAIRSQRYKAKIVEWDHYHEREKVSSYQFVSAVELIEEFWLRVDRFLKENEHE